MGKKKNVIGHANINRRYVVLKNKKVNNRGRFKSEKSGSIRERKSWARGESLIFIYLFQ